MIELDLEATAREQHARFVRRVREARIVWALRSEAGWCTSPSLDHADRSVIPFWSDRAYAARCAKDEWAEYEPAEISLERFVEAWLPGMHRDGYLVGTNWSGNLTGLEVEPAELISALSQQG